MDPAEPNLPASEPASELESSSAAPIEAPVAAVESPVARTSAAGSTALRPYDFRRPAFLSSNESRKLHAQYEEFLRRLGTRLANYLRLEVGLKLHSLETF